MKWGVLDNSPPRPTYHLSSSPWKVRQSHRGILQPVLTSLPQSVIVWELGALRAFCSDPKDPSYNTHTHTHTQSIGFSRLLHHASDGKETACNAGDPGSIPGLGRSLWRRAWQSTAVFLPGESHSGLWGGSWGGKESDMTNSFSFHQLRVLTLPDFPFPRAGKEMTGVCRRRRRKWRETGPLTSQQSTSANQQPFPSLALVASHFGVLRVRGALRMGVLPAACGFEKRLGRCDCGHPEAGVVRYAGLLSRTGCLVVGKLELGSQVDGEAIREEAPAWPQEAGLRA